MEAVKKDLFSPYQMGSFNLSHRIVLAPMTRCRAINEMPNESLEKYYTQRSTPGGLLITEGILISPIASRYTETTVRGYASWFPLSKFSPSHCPGIYTEQQVEAWKKVVHSVHAKGAIIFSQLWYIGHAYDDEHQPEEEDVASSTIDTRIKISESIEQYRQAALNAIRAGFDGVEIHAAHSHSYIVHQHLKKTSTNNQTQVPKTDPVVPITNYLIQVIQAIVDTIGPGKVGVRLFSPAMDAYEGTVCDPLSLGLSVISELNKLQTKIDTKLAFLHFTRPRLTDQRVSKTLRVAYEGTFLSSGGYDKEQGMESVAQGDADLIAYGRYFVANPDLVDRFKVGAFMNKYERDTFYTHDPVVGYTDYPSLQQITSLETMST